MRELRIEQGHTRERTPLVVRGSLPRTFRSVGLFAEALLLICGSYLLMEAILRPLEAGSFSVIGGGSILALATVLLFYLFSPGYRKSMSRREEEHGSSVQAIRLTSYGEQMQARIAAKRILEEEDELPGPM